MQQLQAPAWRELNRRTSDGLDVTLVWEPESDVLCVTVLDTRTGQLTECFPPAADARFAFEHPFVYGLVPSTRALAGMAGS